MKKSKKKKATPKFVPKTERQRLELSIELVKNVYKMDGYKEILKDQLKRMEKELSNLK